LTGVAQPGLDVFGLEFDKGCGAEERFDVAADHDFVDFVGGGLALGFDDVLEPVVKPGAEGQPLGAERDALLLAAECFVQLLGDSFASLPYSTLCLPRSSETEAHHLPSLSRW